MSNKSFVSSYFTGKKLGELKKTITPAWTPRNLKSHLRLIDVPDDAAAVLEVGCGIGRLLRALCGPDRSGIGVDASPDMIREAANYLEGSNAEARLCDGDGSLPLTDEAFDFAYCFTVFQHIADTDTVLGYLTGMAGHLRAGGILSAQFLNQHRETDSPLWSYHDADRVRDCLLDAGMRLEKPDVVTANWTVVRYQKAGGNQPLTTSPTPL